MAIVSKMTRCAACGSTAVTYSEGTKLYHCADTLENVATRT